MPPASESPEGRRNGPSCTPPDPSIQKRRLSAFQSTAAAELKKLTLTNLYNAKPAWLRNAHTQLDSAVAAAYGWPPNLPDDEILRRLLALNHARASASLPAATS